MDCIQSCFPSTLTPFNKGLASAACILAITIMAVGIIGLTAISPGPFNAIVQLGTTINGTLIGVSIFILILDLVWVTILSRKTEIASGHETATDPTVSDAPDHESDVVTDALGQELPAEIIFKIFEHLSFRELVRYGEVSQTCRKWTSGAYLWNKLDLRSISPLIKVFDQSDWEKYSDVSAYGLSFEGLFDNPKADWEKYADAAAYGPSFKDAPLYDNRKTVRVLIDRLRVFSIENNAGITLLTIPKGLTFNKLLKIAAEPKMGKIPQFRNIWNLISANLGDVPVDKTYRIAITNHIFRWSRNLSFSTQQDLLKKDGCRVPHVLEVMALLIMTSISSDSCFYGGGDDFSLTRCSEKIFFNTSRSWEHVYAGGYFMGEGIRSANAGSSTTCKHHIGIGGVMNL